MKISLLQEGETGEWFSSRIFPQCELLHTPLVNCFIFFHPGSVYTCLASYC